MHYRQQAMADKRRYFERDSREKDAANSANNSETSRHSKDQNYDDPPNSRLFILCGRNVSEEELREAFEKFGTIRELWIVKDKNTGTSKGVAYIKYAKTSEAAVAMEEMNGKFIGNNPKSLKVLIASSRDQGSKREANEEERLLRLFIIVPRTMTESDLKDHFMQFGDVEHCNIVRDRGTKESKGYAYVKFHRISHAAKAFEGCERSFKPVFAEPRPQKQATSDDRYSSAHGSTSGQYDMHDYPVEATYHPMINHGHGQGHGGLHDGSCRLTILASGTLNQDQLWRLCDFFPGLDFCNVRHDQKSRQCVATVVYNSGPAAAYAKEKLHGFEYPPGHRLIVKFEPVPDPVRSASGLLGAPNPAVTRYPALTQSSLTHNGTQLSQNLGPNGPHIPGVRSNSSIPPDLATLAESIAQALPIIQAAGLNAASHIPHSQSGESYNPSYCSVKLPPPQPLAPIDSPVLERLFVVCHPTPPALYALKDTFGRFGNLIDIFMLNGKNFGYAKYASKSSADEARNSLHGQEVCGMRLKVFPAEPLEKSNANSTSGGTANSPASIPASDSKCKRLKLEPGISD